MESGVAYFERATILPSVASQHSTSFASPRSISPSFNIQPPRSSLKVSKSQNSSVITKCEIDESLEEFLAKTTPDKGLSEAIRTIAFNSYASTHSHFYKDACSLQDMGGPVEVSCMLDKPWSSYETISQDTWWSSRRHVVSLVSILSFNYGLPLALAANEEEEKDESLVGAFKSLFDPNEKTKSGKVLPKAYLNSAREVVKTLRESLKEDPNNMAKFRRTADAAKSSIREYIGTWRGQKTVINEESYVVIEKAIRSLASFYSKAGPSAPLPEAVKSEIISNLDTADKFL